MWIRDIYIISWSYHIHIYKEFEKKTPVFEGIWEISTIVHPRDISTKNCPLNPTIQSASDHISTTTIHNEPSEFFQILSDILAPKNC